MPGCPGQIIDALEACVLTAQTRALRGRVAFALESLHATVPGPSGHHGLLSPRQREQPFPHASPRPRLPAVACFEHAPDAS